MNYHYALTVKKTRGEKLLLHYDDWILQNEKRGYTISNINYEITKGLHFHAIISANKRISYDDLKTSPHGWNFKLVPLYNKAGWLDYAEKDANLDVRVQQMLQELDEQDPRSRSQIPEDPQESSVSEYSEEVINTNACLSTPTVYKYPNFDIRKLSSGKK